MLKNILFLLLSLLLTKENLEFEYVIQTESTPLNIYWISQDNILLSYLNEAEIFNLENRVRNKLDDCESCIYGYDKEILRCEYTHREIKSMQEFSTTVSIFDSKENLIFKKDIFPTVIPITCTKDYILLKNAYSFLEQKTYYLDIQKSELKEFERERKDLAINSLPPYKNISIGKERVILLTEENLLTVYRRVK
ncbi:MAG: hypothetical protein WC981_01110 [Candidatus Dojkabacteria bacterium]|jgi:hypothetical protein